MYFYWLTFHAKGYALAHCQLLVARLDAGEVLEW